MKNINIDYLFSKYENEYKNEYNNDNYVNFHYSKEKKGGITALNESLKLIGNGEIIASDYDKESLMYKELMKNNTLNIEQKYNPVENVHAVFDGDDNYVSNHSQKVSPFDVIKATAELLGQTVNNPKHNCKKCNGRGFIGRDSVGGYPIPCVCIYPKENKGKNDYVYNKTKSMSRSERRKWERQLKKKIKKQ